MSHCAIVLLAFSAWAILIGFELGRLSLHKRIRELKRAVDALIAQVRDPNIFDAHEAFALRSGMPIPDRDKRAADREQWLADTIRRVAPGIVSKTK